MNKKISFTDRFKIILDGPSQLGELLTGAALVTSAEIDAVTAGGKGAIRGRLGQLLVMSGKISQLELQNTLLLQCYLREKKIELQEATAALSLTRKANLSLEEAIKRIRADKLEPPSARVGDLLLAAEAITKDQLDAALEMNASTGLTVGHVLQLSGVVSEELLSVTLEVQRNLRHGIFTREEAISTLTDFAKNLRGSTSAQPVPAAPPIAFPPPPPKLALELPSADSTVTLPTRNQFAEEILISAKIITELQLANAIRLSFEEKVGVDVVMLRENIVDREILSLAQEMQQLEKDGFVDRDWCVGCLKNMHRELLLAQKSLAAATPPSGAPDTPREAPSLASAHKLPNLGDFMRMCDPNHGEDPTATQQRIGQLCFSLINQGKLSLDEGIFAFDFCRKQVEKNGVTLYVAAEKLGFQTGIWEVQDSLTVT